MHTRLSAHAGRMQGEIHTAAVVQRDQILNLESNSEHVIVRADEDRVWKTAERLVRLPAASSSNAGAETHTIFHKVDTASLTSQGEAGGSLDKSHTPVILAPRSYIRARTVYAGYPAHPS